MPLARLLLTQTEGSNGQLYEICSCNEIVVPRWHNCLEGISGKGVAGLVAAGGFVGAGF